MQFFFWALPSIFNQLSKSPPLIEPFVEIAPLCGNGCGLVLHIS